MASVMYKPTPIINACEVLCNVIKNECNDYMFHLATSHNLIELDVRNRKPVQRWTHLMKAAPQFGIANYSDNEGLIVLQSLNPDEIIGIENSRISCDGPFISKSSPCVLETVKRELRLAQYAGICFHPSINERLNFTVTGIHMYGDIKDSCCLFTINGAGDIMMNRLERREVGEGNSEEKKRDIEEAFVAMQKYEDHSIDLHSRRMVLSETVDMSGVIRELKKKKSKRKKRNNRPINPWPYKEKFSPESLCYYKDFMSERILHIWGIQMKDFWEEGKEVSDDENDIYSAAALRAKVDEWMKAWNLKP